MTNLSTVNPCPWGAPQSVKTFAPGIQYVETAGHGGFIISNERLAEMNPILCNCCFLKSHPWAFEEDCAWCAVVLQWPEHFSNAQIASAQDTYNHYYRAKHGAYPTIMGVLA